MTELMKATILVVDDEDDIRELLCDEFKPLVARIFEASNGSMALEIVKNEKIDLIISDFRMPIASGLELLKSIKKNATNMPKIIFCSGLVSDLTRAEVQALGDYPLVGKPFDLDALVKQVKTLLESE